MEYPRLTVACGKDEPDGILSSIGMHYHIDQIKGDLLENRVFKYIQTVQAEVVDMTDRLVVEAIVNAARQNKVDDLYLIDKNFILEAITEKLDRMRAKA